MCVGLVGGTGRLGKRRRRVEGVESRLEMVCRGEGTWGGVGGDEDVDGGWGMRSDGWWWGVWVGLYRGSWAKLGVWSRTVGWGRNEGSDPVLW